MPKHSNNCLHCQQPIPPHRQDNFCCSGCASAYSIIKGLHLETYYKQRELDPNGKPLIPEQQSFSLLSHFEIKDGDLSHIYLLIDGLHCAACVWLIEHALQKENGVDTARLNMTTHRLHISFNPTQTTSEKLITRINQLGYTVAPYNPELLKSQQQDYEKKLLLSLGVAGFAAANVMLLSVALWAGAAEESPSLALFLQWLSALIVLPTTAYAGQPFFSSAWKALKTKHFNMDVPISIAICLTLILSFIEMLRPLQDHTGHTWFESSAMLLFFLLIGRYLDHRTKGRTQNASERLAALQAHSATKILSSGQKAVIPIQQLQVDDIILINAGETCPADGIVIQGTSTLDSSLLTGESLPIEISEHSFVSAGTINLSNPIKVKVIAVGNATKLNHIATLVEEATTSKNKYTRIADKLSKLYAPVVHILSALTFIFWFIFTKDSYQALVIATSVLIITCPCALALAVPAVQVASVNKLLKHGILVTSASGLERLAQIKSIVFDKTGTLTTGQFSLQSGHKNNFFKLASALAQFSNHPLAKALSQHKTSSFSFHDIQEVTGAGLQAFYNNDILKLGNASFVQVPQDMLNKHQNLPSNLWLSYQNHFEVFTFSDTLKPEAPQALSLFKSKGLPLFLCSGDTKDAVMPVQKKLHFLPEHTKFSCSPEEKYSFIQSLSDKNLYPLMCGDGINDAPSLAAAHASIAMGSGADISQITADIILQKNSLLDAYTALEIAQKATHLIKINFGLSFGYNAIAIPLAMLGYITPLWAALFMSASSITVVLNALRLQNMKIKLKT